MRAALAPLAAQAGATVVEIDLDSDAALDARFGDRVPVLLLGDLDGPELSHYVLDADRVREALVTPK